MKKYIKKSMLAVVVIFTLLVATSVAFADDAYSVVYDYSSNTVTISGTADDHVYARVLAYGKTWSDLEETPYDDSVVIYRNQINKKDFVDGKYSFVFRYAELDDMGFQSGIYNLYLTSKSYDEPIHIELNLLLKALSDNVIDAINECAKAGDAQGLKVLFDENAKVLVYNEDMYSAISSSSEIEACMEYIKENPLSKDDSIENAKVLNRFFAMQALSENKAYNIDEIVLNVIDDDNVYGNYLEYTKGDDNKPSSAKQEYLTKKMSTEIPDNYDYDDFEKAMKKAILLTAVRYADGYGDVKNALGLYGELIGIMGTASSDIYKAMSGKDYDDTDELKEDYNSLKKQNSSQGTGGSSSGNGSGGYKKPVYSAGVSNIATPETGEKHNPVAVYFDDIDGVEWASTAILALADKGIINGVGDGKFKPNGNVTREEFTKILVCSMGLQNESFDKNNFVDVKENDWFYSYVNIAYENNIVNGIGEGKFGTGEPISRQDMVVMICNAIKSNGKILPHGNVDFEDFTLISDYAKESVESLYELGVINGVSATHFEPLGKTTRAQAAKVVYGVLQMLQ